MKKQIIAGMLALALLGGATMPAFAQDMKSNKKERKATKKMHKGKMHKAMKKDKKSEDKAEVGR